MVTSVLFYRAARAPLPPPDGANPNVAAGFYNELFALKPLVLAPLLLLPPP